MSETPAQGAASTPPKQTETRQSIEHGLLVQLALAVMRALRFDGRDFRQFPDTDVRGRKVDIAKLDAEARRDLDKDSDELRWFEKQLGEARWCVEELLVRGYEVPPLWRECVWSRMPDVSEPGCIVHGFRWRHVAFGLGKRDWLVLANEAQKRLDGMEAAGGASAETEGVAGAAAPPVTEATGKPKAAPGAPPWKWAGLPQSLATLAEILSEAGRPLEAHALAHGRLGREPSRILSDARSKWGHWIDAWIDKGQGRGLYSLRSTPKE